MLTAMAVTVAAVVGAWAYVSGRTIRRKRRRSRRAAKIQATPLAFSRTVRGYDTPELLREDTLARLKAASAGSPHNTPESSS